MSHYFYIEEIEKKARKSQLYWLFFIVSFSLAIIGLLVIINTETNLFLDFETKHPGFSAEKRISIEKRVLGSWAKKELGLEDRENIEKELETEVQELSTEEKSSIESRLQAQQNL
ncbi:MAG: hypothetical protein AAB534_03145 [Patescibacteria group bacterium]